jgi:hypothetical protein
VNDLTRHLLDETPATPDYYTRLMTLDVDRADLETLKDFWYHLKDDPRVQQGTGGWLAPKFKKLRWQVEGGWASVT